MNPDICVLMCTYNGEKYIRRQLDSLNDQKNVQVSFAVHDDGSTDNTQKILLEYGITPQGSAHMGPAIGFMNLLGSAPESNYYAFCDQDDIWDDDKLSSAVSAIRSAESDEPGIPCIYCCSTRLVSANEEYICDHIIENDRTLQSRLFYASISGNTVVFNNALRTLALEHIPGKLIMHDSWMVKLCIACGGRLIIDPKPHMNYRMHSANQVGMEISLKQKLKKFIKVTGNDGEGQELLDICSFYKDRVLSEYRDLADLVVRSRSEFSARLQLIRKGNIDFKNSGFNLAFRIKVLRGSL